jgi:hypothetical protein
MATRCKFCKTDGSQCRANAQPDNGLCVFHDPAKAADVEKARRAGGISRSSPARVLPADALDLALDSSKDVASLLAETISQVRRGQLDPRIANTIGYLSVIHLKALEQGVVEERLLKIEAALSAASRKEITKDADRRPQAFLSS